MPSLASKFVPVTLKMLLLSGVVIISASSELLLAATELMVAIEATRLKLNIANIAIAANLFFICFTVCFVFWF
jgi:hypothetical protein